MKKDIFHGKIKKEYFSYILFYIIFIALLMFVVGGMALGVGLWANAGPVIGIIFMRILGVAIIALGIAYIVGCMLVIRKYPKYEKLRRILYNSDCYFTDSESKEYHGHWRRRTAFNAVTAIAEQNKDLVDIKYPKTYGTFIILSIVGIFFMFFNILLVWLALKNISALPHGFQSEDVIFAVFIVVEVVDMILSFVFAFRVKKIREKTIDEYRAEQKKMN